MDSLPRNDVLASNLLFVTLGLSILFQVTGGISQALELPHNYFSPLHFTWLAVGGVVLLFLVRGALYYAVRLGRPAAKLLLILGFLVNFYTTTHWRSGLVDGMDFTHFGVPSLLALLNNLLTLAALVLMFWLEREPTSEGA